MKINLFRWPVRLLLLNAAVLLLTAGCATHDQRSYNQDYNQNLPTSPKYTIENVDDTHFHVIVHQGSPLDAPQRVIEVKQAASAVAETEARQRGWQNWDLAYIQERDQGWMHIVIADVTRKNAVAMTSGPTNNNP
jgi:type IV pilus biogenesis protein CpaD/CtpE